MELIVYLLTDLRIFKLKSSPYSYSEFQWALSAPVDWASLVPRSAVASYNFSAYLHFNGTLQARRRIFRRKNYRIILKMHQYNNVTHGWPELAIRVMKITGSVR